MSEQKLNRLMADHLYMGDVKEALDLVQKGANPNFNMGDGVTPVIFVALLGDYPDAIQSLCEAGADIHACDNKGRNAMRAAQLIGSQDNISKISEIYAQSDLEAQPRSRAVLQSGAVTPRIEKNIVIDLGMKKQIQKWRTHRVRTPELINRFRMTGT